MLEGFSRTHGRGRLRRNSQHNGQTIGRVLRIERRVRVRPHDAFQQKHETEDRQLKRKGIGRGHTRDPYVSIQAKRSGPTSQIQAIVWQACHENFIACSHNREEITCQMTGSNFKEKKRWKKSTHARN
jgi:hypothetical protein